MVACAYNPSYLESRNQENFGLRPAWTKRFMLWCVSIIPAVQEAQVGGL
jgi:hypothetical protein